MTFLLLINCCLTTFGPLFVLYKSSILSGGHGTRMLCALAAVGYLASRLCQSIILVSITPEWLAPWILTLCVGLTDYIDVLIIHLFLKIRTVAAFDYESRILGTGLGWAAADAFATNFAWIVVEARTGDFDWSFIDRSLTSNLNGVVYIIITALVFLWNRQKSGGKTPIALSALIGYNVAIPIFLWFLKTLPVAALTVLLAKAACVSSSAVLTYHAVKALSFEKRA